MSFRDIVLIKSLYKAKDVKLWVEAIHAAIKDEWFGSFVEKLIEVSSQSDFSTDANEVSSLLEIFSAKSFGDLPIEIQLSLLEKLAFAENLLYSKESTFQTVFVKAAITLDAPYVLKLVDQLQNYNVQECALVADLNTKHEIAEVLRKKLPSKCRTKNCTCEAYVNQDSKKCKTCNHSKIWHQLAAKPQLEAFV